MDRPFPNDEIKAEHIKISANAADGSSSDSLPAQADGFLSQTALAAGASTVADENTSEKVGPVKAAFLFVGTLICWTILVLGQLFMVADVAVGSGTIASSLFGLSFDRIMYHCGAQDTFMSGFILGAVPIFWSSWYLHKRRIWKYILMGIFAIPVSLMLSVLMAPNLVSGLGVGIAVFALLFLMQMCGSHLASYQKNWPRRFSVSKLLLICYVPAIIVLGYELSNLDILSGTADKVPDESMFGALGAIAAFSFLPALLNSIAVKTRRFGSGFGLSSIGQLPLLISAVLYCIANGIMLLCFNIFGATALADYFTRISGGLSTEFELMPSNTAELWSKLLCSLLVCGLVFASVWAGSFIGVLWNRWRRREEHSFYD